MVDQYIFSGSLPEEATTYVTRSADGELYTGLKAGKFCYVLNSRQSGKSSLRVQIMRRLREEGVKCAAIDLSAGGIQNVPPEQWYVDLIDTLIGRFELDIDFVDWWSQNQLNSLVTRFRKFIEEILLAEVKENIVIFIDEIDSVLSLEFPTDDFFALIRACYNKRVDNPEYNRLTFCLLGVASPSNLIEDKQRTPFNIGKAISLTGFQLHEVEPLEKGFHGKYTHPQAVMKEILHWTGGQPFLTQKLCQFMVEESQSENPRSVEQVVRSRIIENWESQDEPEHLRTIRARILRDEQRAGYLLELYQMVRLDEGQSTLSADNTLEQSELQLSGLVFRQHNKLKVYNLIYQEIFDDNWIENQLKNLRPYSESFRFWVASGGTDESRLLRGKALLEAEEWAIDKSLSYQDKQFLAASKEKEIQSEIAAKEQEAALKEQEAALERESQDKEAAQKRNQMLSKANKKAQRQIVFGFVVLVFTVVGAVTVALLSEQRIKVANQKVKETDEEVEAVKKLNKLAGELENQKSSNSDYNEALRLSALSFNIDNHLLKQALVFAAKSQADQQLKKLDDAEQEIKKSKKNLDAAEEGKKFKETDLLQIQVLFYKIKGSFLAQKNKNEQAIEAYSTAFNILKQHPKEIDFTKDNQFITGGNITSVHRDLIELLSKKNTESDLRKRVEQSLTKHLYAQLIYFLNAKNWAEADRQTYQLMLNIAKREGEEYLDYNSIKSFSCPDLQRIDKLWFNSDNRFGFRVQKEIWIRTGNRLGIEPAQWNDLDVTNYFRFAKAVWAVGWYDDKVRKNATGDSRGAFEVSLDELYEGIKKHHEGYRGSLPLYVIRTTVFYYVADPRLPSWGFGLVGWYHFFSRVAACKV